VAEQFGVSPEQLDNVSDYLAENGSQVKGVESSLQGEGGGGCAISPGDMDSFWSQLDWVEGSLGAKAHLLDYYANYLKQAAAKFQGFDQGSGPVV
jgi:hypothetical protein